MRGILRMPPLELSPRQFYVSPFLIILIDKVHVRACKSRVHVKKGEGCRSIGTPLWLGRSGICVGSLIVENAEGFGLLFSWISIRGTQKLSVVYIEIPQIKDLSIWM